MPPISATGQVRPTPTPTPTPHPTPAPVVKAKTPAPTPTPTPSLGSNPADIAVNATTPSVGWVGNVASGATQVASAAGAWARNTLNSVTLFNKHPLSGIANKIPGDTFSTQFHDNGGWFGVQRKGFTVDTPSAVTGALATPLGVYSTVQNALNVNKQGGWGFGSNAWAPTGTDGHGAAWQTLQSGVGTAQSLGQGLAGAGSVATKALNAADELAPALKVAARLGAGVGEAAGELVPGANIAIAGLDTAKTAYDFANNASVGTKVTDVITTAGSWVAASNVPVVSQIGAAVSIGSSLVAGIFGW